MATPRADAAGRHLPSQDAPHRNRRDDIQGLRGLAVLVVVAFHAGLPLPGGFVGVDVFFVISGFVITSMLQREFGACSRVQFVRFYARRFKRLTPALALTVSVSVVISFLFLPPFSVQGTAGETGVGAMLLMANFIVGISTGDYFDVSASSNPLLNTWSLSVEEQFYLLFPIILLTGWLLSRRPGKWSRSPYFLVGFLAAASFAAAVMGSSGTVGMHRTLLLGFYSPLSRAWEFAVGALLAFALRPDRLWTPSPRVGQIFGAFGLVLFVTSLFVITEATPFPGLWTLLPVVAAVLILAAGSEGTSAVTRTLSLRPLSKMGDWSYSIYLWHWPFIVFATLLWPTSSYAALLAAGVSLLPAWASYRYLEQPLRAYQPPGRRQWDILVAVVLMPPLMLSAALVWAQGSFWSHESVSLSGRVTHEGDVGHSSFYNYMQEKAYPCTPSAIHDRAPAWEGVKRCFQSQRGSPATVALLGDSHAESLFPGFAEALPHQNVVYYLIPSPSTEQDSELILDHIAKSPEIRTIVVSEYWAVQGEPEAKLVAALRSALAAGKQVFITDDVANFNFGAEECKYQKALVLPWTQCDQDASTFWTTQRGYHKQLELISRQVPGVRLLDTSGYFCSDTSCSMLKESHLMYRDRNHLNLGGSRYTANRMLRESQELRTATGAPTLGLRK